MTEIATMLGTKLTAPKSRMVGYDWSDNTNPSIKPVIPTSEKDLFPIIKHCLRNSFHSKPVLNIFLKKPPIKTTWSPAAANCFVKNEGIDLVIILVYGYNSV
jgi:hypothetical protein